MSMSSLGRGKISTKISSFKAKSAFFIAVNKRAKHKTHKVLKCYYENLTAFHTTYHFLCGTMGKFKNQV